MKKFGQLVSFALLAVLGTVIGAPAQPSSESYDQDAMMKEWTTKYGLPTEEHEYLEYFVGEWKTRNTNYTGPEAVVVEGTAHIELSMGGRYLQETHRSNMDGMPFEGHGITGFDRTTGEYFNIWLDNMGTGFLESRGKKLRNGRGHEVSGMVNDPMRGETEFRMVTTILDEDSYKFEMFMEPQGAEEDLSMTITYNRVAS